MSLLIFCLDESCVLTNEPTVSDSESSQDGRIVDLTIIATTAAMKSNSKTTTAEQYDMNPSGLNEKIITVS